MYKIKTVLTSPESALLLNELYNDEYCTKLDAAAENVFGNTLIRDNESILDFNRLGMVLTEYTELDIGKFFHISYVEYKSLTTYERDIMNDKAIELIKKATEEYNSMKNKEEQSMTDLSSMGDVY